MLPDGVPYTEEQLYEMTKLYDELKAQFMEHKDYAQGLVMRGQNGEQLSEKEVKDLSLFVKVSETLTGLEDLIVGELSASIIGICEEAKLRAKEGDKEWMDRWERMQPIYKWYMEIFAQRALPKN
jgi:hypothetical protein